MRHLSWLQTEITRMRDEARLLAGSDPNIADRAEADQRALALDDVLALVQQVTNSASAEIERELVEAQQP